MSGCLETYLWLWCFVPYLSRGCMYLSLCTLDCYCCLGLPLWSVVICLGLFFVRFLKVTTFQSSLTTSICWGCSFGVVSTVFFKSGSWCTILLLWQFICVWPIIPHSVHNRLRPHRLEAVLGSRCICDFSLGFQRNFNTYLGISTSKCGGRTYICFD